MESISTLIKVGIPNYLSGLPIPNTFGGWFKLGCKLKSFAFAFFLRTFTNFNEKLKSARRSNELWKFEID
jgi:Iron-containing outer mitochondrial membrane protein N-terminus